MPQPQRVPSLSKVVITIGFALVLLLTIPLFLHHSENKKPGKVNGVVVAFTVRWEGDHFSLAYPGNVKSEGLEFCKDKEHLIRATVISSDIPGINDGWICPLPP